MRKTNPHRPPNCIFSGFLYILLSLLIWISNIDQGIASEYKILDPSLPSDTSDKIEVLVFFSYLCAHCASIEPLLENWSKSLPQNIILKRIPIAYNPAMKSLQQLFFTLLSLDRIKDLHQKVFEDIFIHNQYLFDYKSIKKWAQKYRFDLEKFDSAFNSFSVKLQMKQANQLAYSCKIDGVPMFLVGGKYITSPAMTGNGYISVLSEIDKLLFLIQSEGKNKN